MTSYATSHDYEDYTGKTSPSDITLRLRRASRNVDKELLSARYDITDPYVVQALRDATCEQADSLRSLGYAGGLPVVYSDVKIGSVALGGRSAATSGAAPGQVPFSDTARTILQVAGLTGGAPGTDTGLYLDRSII